MMDLKNFKKQVLQKSKEYKGGVSNLFDESISVGIEIDQQSINVVQLKKNDSVVNTLISLGSKKAPVSSQDAKDKKDPEVFTLMLMDLWQEQKIKTKKVKLSISDPGIYMRHITVPRINENELIKAIKWQAEKYVPFSIDNAIVDFQILDTYTSSDKSNMDIVLVAVEQKIIEQYLTILRGAKLTPLVIDVTPFSIAKAYMTNMASEDNELIALINIGSRSTSLILLKGKSLMFVRKFEVGGLDITRAFAKGMNLELAQTEELSGQHVSEPNEAVAVVLEEIYQQVERSFVYCERELLADKIKKIVLSGEGAQRVGLMKDVERRFSIPVEKAHPFNDSKVIDLSQSSKETLDQLAMNMMAALGSAL